MAKEYGQGTSAVKTGGGNTGDGGNSNPAWQWHQGRAARDQPQQLLRTKHDSPQGISQPVCLSGAVTGTRPWSGHAWNKAWNRGWNNAQSRSLH